LKRAKDVELQRRAATNEVDEIIRGQDLQARIHEEEQLPDAQEAIEQIEQQHEEEQQQRQQEEIIVVADDQQQPIQYEDQRAPDHEGVQVIDANY
jgi:hypothetical protein